jgi:methylthioribose-1-phosphate isomerase
MTDAQTESFVRVRAAMTAFRVQETPAIAAARAYGVDIGLLKKSMLRTPIERVQRNDEILATLAKMRRNR